MKGTEDPTNSNSLEQTISFRCDIDTLQTQRVDDLVDFHSMTHSANSDLDLKGTTEGVHQRLLLDPRHVNSGYK